MNPGHRRGSGLKERGLKGLNALLQKFLTPPILSEFHGWLVNKNLDERYIDSILKYIRKPLKLKDNHSIRAYRNFLNFLHGKYGIDVSKYLDKLKFRPSNPDLNIPDDREILKTYNVLLSLGNQKLLKYFLLLLTSGLRVRDLVYFLAKPGKKTYSDELIAIYRVAKFRKSKKSFYLYTFKNLDFLDIKGLSKDYYVFMARKKDLVRAKYIRKWVASKMFELEIPESIIDFIQGRTPRSVLLRHYIGLFSISIKYYKKYAKYLKNFLGGK